MKFVIGQKVSYPNHGICSIERIESKEIVGKPLDFFILRVLSNNSTILVPEVNAASVGLRPIITFAECSNLIQKLDDNFPEANSDWKIRVRDYTATIQNGDVFEIIKIVKQLTYLTYSKQLSFREQRLLEKAKNLIVAELAIVSTESELSIEQKVNKLIQDACQKHLLDKVPEIGIKEV